MKQGVMRIATCCFILLFVFSAAAFAQGRSAAADYLFETGKKYFERGDYQQALHELEKALLADPEHAKALSYIHIIEEELGLSAEQVQTEQVELYVTEVSREEAVELALQEVAAALISVEEVPQPEEEVWEPEKEVWEPEEEISPLVEEIREEIAPIPPPKTAVETIMAAAPKEIEEGLLPQPVAEEVEEELFPPEPEEISLPSEPEKVEKEVSRSPLEGFDNFVEGVNEKISPVKISGEYHMAMGVTSEDITGKLADADLSERNWRYMDVGQERFNCFDPAIYNRFKLNIETDTTGPLDAYVSLVVDPWSFRGTSRKVDLSGTGSGGIAEVELKYFSSNRRALNETYRSTTGDSLNIPEMKVIDDWTTGLTKTSEWSNNFPIPALEIDREFMPIRKLWFDLGEPKAEDEHGVNLRLFPWASEEQALTTDDPLMLSNRHNYWEPSPWLWSWEEHQIFSATNAFKPGKWSDTLAFRARDSEGYRLTYLRGASLEAKTDRFSLQATVAPPLSPWDDYQIVNNIPGAARLKLFPWEEVMLGSTYTFRTGYSSGKEDSFSNTVGIDTEIKFSPQATFKAEAAISKSNADQTSEVNQWRNRNEDTGQAYKAELILTSEGNEISSDTLKIKAAATYMGKDFDTALSHYLETRDDMFWGKHISFSESLEDYEPFRIGDGIDVNRYVGELDLRAKLFEERLALLFNLRNVHRVSDDNYIETLFRNEGTYKFNPKLTAKWLVINRDLPKTVANYDPLIVKDDGEPFLNYVIEDDKDPSTLTSGLGLKYDFTESISLEGIYERSNDLPDFPRSLLNDIAYIGTKTEGGITYDDVGNQLYQQGFFPLPPYDYFNIYKAKLTYQPLDDLTLRLNYTRNTFEHAGPVDDNMNHAAFGADYSLSEKLAFSFRYVYSKFIDVYRQNIGEGVHYDGHHNFYAETRYDFGEDKRLRLQYGTFGYFNPAAGEYSTGWSLATVDTEHLFRVFLDGKF